MHFSNINSKQNVIIDYICSVHGNNYFLIIILVMFCSGGQVIWNVFNILICMFVPFLRVCKFVALKRHFNLNLFYVCFVCVFR